ncbi:MAG: hypothetical protein JOZ25_07390, partial [Actinobacteria bacterium]|nr:hypothetical protein [Actinomycetota bacterium]
MRLIPTYRRRPTPLHAARAGAAATLCGAYVLAALLFSSPILLAAVVGGLVLLAAGSSVLGELRRSVLLALPLAVVIVLVNSLVYREGAHVIFRGGVVLGRRLDVTLESVAAGGVAALRLVAIACAFGVYSAAVDPDEMLRLFRRVSYRSALTGSLAARLAQVLHRDAMRMSEAGRCRPQPPRRGRVLLAVLSRSLDRALDVAAALEVRGYARARRPARRRGRWSRHDVRVAGAAAVVAGVAVTARALGAGAFHAYPTVSLTIGMSDAVVVACLLIGGLLPAGGPGARF